VADDVVTALDATAEITGAGNGAVGAAVLPPHVRTVIEYGGSERPEEALKLLSVELVILTTLEVSLVSVGLADVNCCIWTVPEGALDPLKVTGSALLRDRLKTMAERLLPLAKANECRK
jgi:hypothetical protein